MASSVEELGAKARRLDDLAASRPEGERTRWREDADRARAVALKLAALGEDGSRPTGRTSSISFAMAGRT